MHTISLEDAEYSDLIRFAQLRGLDDVKYGQVNKTDLVARLKAAFPDLTSIEVEGAAETPAATPVSSDPRRGPSHYRNDPKVLVNIASDPLNGGTHAFPITVGPDLILVKRDTDAEIPYRHYLALANAIETVMSQESNPVTGRLMDLESDQNAVRFTVKRLPSAEEIAAFHERTKDNGREPMKKAA